MNIEIIETDNQVKVRILGRVDTVTASELEKQLLPYYSMQGIRLTLDCNSMEYISSAGLRVVLTTHRNITAKGGHMNIRNVTKEVRSVFDMTGFSRILTID